MANGSQDIEFSKGSIKFSYLRFLSDSAPGYFAILIFLYCYKLYRESIEEIPNISFVESGNIPIEIILFVLFLLFLLATPVGLVINATSWVFLGRLEIWSEVLWVEEIKFDNRYLNRLNPIINLIYNVFVKSTKDKFLFAECKAFYKLNRNNWYCKSKLFEEVLLIYYPDVLKSQNHVDGVRNLLRNIILLVLFIVVTHVIILLKNQQLIVEIRFHMITFSILLFILIVILSLVSFYYDLCVLFNGYLLDQRKDLDTIPIIIDLGMLANSKEFCPESRTDDLDFSYLLY
jgi:hypothetical protein